MKVWVGYWDHGYDGNSEPTVAFSSEEKAEAWCKEMETDDEAYEPIPDYVGLEVDSPG